MRLLFVSNLYPPLHFGGYELLCQEVAERLQARGHTVEVLTSDYRVTGQMDEPGVFRHLKLESDIYHYHPLEALAHYLPDRLNNLKAVRNQIVASKPDVVVVWGMWKLSPTIAAEIERCAGSRVVYYLANEWPMEPGAHEGYWQGDANSFAGKAFKRVLRVPVRLALRQEWRPVNLRLEHVITCSAAVRDNLVAAGVPVSHASVIYHGIDPQPYAEARDRRLASGQPSNGSRVVFVGSLIPHKGVHTAIEALRYLPSDRASSNLTLDILGSGHPDYEAQLHKQVEQLGLQSRVSFHPPIPRADLPGFLADYDILVLPSIWNEPQARISQEAMAGGLVLVGTPTGGTREILIDGQNGLAFPPEDARCLAQQLDALARDPALRARLAAAGRQTVAEKFTAARMIDQLENALQDVASRHS